MEFIRNRFFSASGRNEVRGYPRHAHTQMCTSRHAHTRTHTCAHTDMHTHTLMCTQTCTHTDVHTHVHLRPLSRLGFCGGVTTCRRRMTGSPRASAKQPLSRMRCQVHQHGGGGGCFQGPCGGACPPLPRPLPPRPSTASDAGSSPSSV